MLYSLKGCHRRLTSDKIGRGYSHVKNAKFVMTIKLSVPQTFMSEKLLEKCLTISMTLNLAICELKNLWTRKPI